MANSINASKHKQPVSGKGFPGIEPQIHAKGLESDQKGGKVYEDLLYSNVQCCAVDSGELVVSETVNGQIHFYSGNPSVKRVNHVRKEQMIPLTNEVPERKMIFMVAVPASLKIHDIVRFIAPSAEGIELLKIIRDASSNQDMAIVEFKNARLADEFYSQYNGKVFNSNDNQPCFLKYVAFVERGMPEVTKFCTICSGRFDDAGNIYIVLLCGHTFHASCLSPVRESCPECGIFKPLEVELSKCFTCTNQETLYLCLECGVVSCQSHADTHFKTTQHMYALQVGGNKVWNYAGQNFFHLHSKDGEKLLPLKALLLFIQHSSQKAYEKISRIQEEVILSEL
ncbi:BRCA1-associated protein-like [Anneissia japonica]|uniref:BRCA1-associated protein-like n=1 Tax=Anneissia japonica TaxID=1529436 RepID=UPI001425A140|nr:BRCA1-associated protein-like [Anneissia japonica]